MKYQRIHFQTPDAYLDTYFLDASPQLLHSDVRPLVLVCPGGGYLMNSDREAEPIALAFAAQGFHAAVLRYPVAPARFPSALYALGEAMLWLRAHAEENHIDPQQIIVSGYSAGGHLAASLGVFWHKPFLSRHLQCDAALLRPAALLLGYPVITSGEFAHRNSFIRLLGEDATEEALAEVSLEKHVTSQTPPAFLWHTYTDELVPVENSMLFADALRKAGVPFELHIYSTGIHGLALSGKVTEEPEIVRVCDACTGWVELACAWLRRQTHMFER